MQCFICVTYMIILCSSNPIKNREIATIHEKRSLFRDVIESLRLHSQLPEDINQSDENNLSQNYVRYEDEPPLPSDADYIPRRNDRIEMPSMKYRFPKSINTSSSDEMKTREEVVVFIDTNKYKMTTSKPKKDKRPRPTYNKNKNPNKNKENEDNVNTDDADNEPEDFTPLTNTMAGQSQIGNRETQTVLKPTVIVNIRGTVTHRDSDIRIEGREESLSNKTVPLQNIFNINQEIKIEREGNKKKPSTVKQEIKMVGEDENPKIEEDMMMCETATWKPDKSQETRKLDSVLQILFSI